MKELINEYLELILEAVIMSLFVFVFLSVTTDFLAI